MDVLTALSDVSLKFWNGTVSFATNTNNLFAFLLIAILFAYDILRKGWAASFTQRAVSGSIASILIMFSSILFVPFVYVSVTWLQSMYVTYDLPHVSTDFWSGVPIWVAGLVAIVSHDLCDYTTHRLMHTNILWPIHAMHHSDKEVNGLTTFRIHFLEAIMMKSSYVILFSWAGFSAEALTFGAALLLLHNVYIHADLDWDHGPFKFLLASPKFHRWHHADHPMAYGKNLANIIPAYDYMFGTYYNPGTTKAEMGAKGVPHADVMALHAYPFVMWTKALKKRFRKVKAAAPKRAAKVAE